MNEFEVMVLVFFVLVVVAYTVFYKFKQAEKRIEALFKLEEARRFDEAHRQRIKHRQERLDAFAKAEPKTNSGFVQPLRTTSQPVTSTYRSAPTNVVVDNSSSDLLNAMIIQNALNSSQYEAPTTHYSNTSNPVDFPTSTPEPSYSAPEPERSSYSSSYSSSSSDSSYSSSSSDSSYSSSSDSSSSSSSD